MEELKPCPFCGKNKCVRIRVYPSNDLERIDQYSVVCDRVHGGCGSESGHYITAENAIKAWNKRTFYKERKVNIDKKTEWNPDCEGCNPEDPGECQLCRER